jgi:hypothetical protein
MDSHERCSGMPNFLKERESTKYPLFNLVKARAKLYANSLRRTDIIWMGLRLFYHLIWCPTRAYIITIEWDEFNELVQWTQVEINLGFYTLDESGHLSYNWSDIHVGFLDID